MSKRNCAEQPTVLSEAERSDMQKPDRKRNLRPLALGVAVVGVAIGLTFLVNILINATVRFVCKDVVGPTPSLREIVDTIDVGDQYFPHSTRLVHSRYYAGWSDELYARMEMDRKDIPQLMSKLPPGYQRSPYGCSELQRRFGYRDGNDIPPWWNPYSITECTSVSADHYFAHLKILIDKHGDGKVTVYLSYKYQPVL
jgi:hypothetical protein